MDNNLRRHMRDIHDEVSPDYYDKSMAENSFQRFWHTRTIDAISKMLRGRRGSLLDIGCGGGTLLDMIIQKSEQKYVVGIDASKQAICYANMYHKQAFFLSADFY